MAHGHCLSEQPRLEPQGSIVCVYSMTNVFAMIFRFRCKAPTVGGSNRDHFRLLQCCLCHERGRLANVQTILYAHHTIYSPMCDVFGV